MATDIVIFAIVGVLLVVGFGLYFVAVLVADALFKEYRSMVDNTGVLVALLTVLGFMTLRLVTMHVLPLFTGL